MANSRMLALSRALAVAPWLSLHVAGAGAAGPDAGLNVNVTNPASSPVPVSIQGTGSITGNVTVTNTGANPVPVTGTVSVGITGTPSVNVANVPETTSGDRTVILASGNFVSDATFKDLFDGDLTPYKTVKLVMTCFDKGCMDLTARVYDSDPVDSMLIDEFALPPGNVLAASVRFYDLPGAHFGVQIVNSNPGAAPRFHYRLVGRRN